jgi:hypothetical protein
MIWYFDVSVIFDLLKLSAVFQAKTQATASPIRSHRHAVGARLKTRQGPAPHEAKFALTSRLNRQDADTSHFPHRHLRMLDFSKIIQFPR